MLSSSIRVSVSLGALLLVAAHVRADTLKVPSNDFATIQAAVDAAGEGDIISIGKGVKIAKLKNGGVSFPKFSAFEKNSNTASRGAGITCCRYSR